nr:GGDEF domain-containing protein [uncultured Agathobacter sp.]
MEEFKKLNLRQKIISFIVMFLITVTTIAVFMSMTSAKRVDSDEIELDDGWSVTINGKEYDNVTLSKFRFKMCNRGDVLTLRHIVPRYDIILLPTLEVYTIHSAIKVYLDDEVIYTYGQRLYDENKLLGYGEHFVSMPYGANSKWLTVEMTVSEDNAFDGVKAMKLLDGNSAMVKDLSGKRVNLSIAMFLIVFGVIIMVLSMLMLRRAVNFVQTFCIALFSFLIGCWTLCNNELIEYFTTDLLMKSYLEYYSLYISPLPLTYYFRDKIDVRGNPKWLKIYFWGLVAAEIVYIASAVILQEANLVHLPQILVGSHILMILTIVLILMISVIDIKVRKQRPTVVMIGFLIAIAIVVVELIRFNMEKYITGFTKNAYSSDTCFAVLIIVISMLLDYGNKTSKSLYENAQRAVLEQMAYMDELTGLGNRRMCEKKITELEEKEMSSDSVYAIVSLDLNFLKRTNDTYGHKKGDELIKSFSDVLSNVFSLYGTVTRTGGDEFVVILDDITEEKVKSLLAQMLEQMEEKNKSASDVILSTAYGYAMKGEIPSKQEKTEEIKLKVVDIGPRAVYRIADDRMYENKRKSKLGRQ